jgi:CheY-like chemotaxis protein
VTRVLVIDDDADIVDALSLVLETHGHEVATASNGVEGLALLETWCACPGPRVILLDLMMPVMDGWEFCAKMARTPVAAGTPVIVLTGDGRSEDKAVLAGACIGLRKPVDLETLLDSIERCASDPQSTSPQLLPLPTSTSSGTSSG